MKEDIYYRIDQYLNNELSESDRLEFEAACKADPELMAALKLQVRARYASHYFARNQQQQHYTHSEELNKSEEEGAIVRKFSMQKYFLAAAVVLLLFTSIFIFLNDFRSSHPEAIYEEYFTSAELKTVRSSHSQVSDSLDQAWNDALNAYSKKEFATAAKKFDNLVRVDTFNFRDQANLYAGISYLKTEQPQKALQSLSLIAEDNQSLHFDAVWYTAMAYLYQEDVPKTMATLEQLKESRTYGDRAKEIIEILQ